MTPSAYLSVTSLQKKYKASVVLQDVSFGIDKGDRFVITGPSGSGKSTLIKIIAGIEIHDSGHLYMQGNCIDQIDTHKRAILYLFQEPLLLPHMTVAENVALGPKLQGKAGAESRDIVSEMLEITEISAHAHQYPKQLSGGQRQRVALARAWALQPRLILLDEPFSALDYDLQQRLWDQYLLLCERYGTTTVLVTHNIHEALKLGTRFARLDQGRLQVYADRSDFIKDEATGVSKEVSFWKNLNNEI